MMRILVIAVVIALACRLLLGKWPGGISRPVLPGDGNSPRRGACSWASSRRAGTRFARRTVA